MTDTIMQLANMYFGVAVSVVVIVLLIGTLKWLGVSSVFSLKRQSLIEFAESDDDVYAVPTNREERLHSAEANQGGEDDDTFSR
jgi:uncharacterized membrane protein